MYDMLHSLKRKGIRFLAGMDYQIGYSFQFYGRKSLITGNKKDHKEVTQLFIHCLHWESNQEEIMEICVALATMIERLPGDADFQQITLGDTNIILSRDKSSDERNKTEFVWAFSVPGENISVCFPLRTIELIYILDSMIGFFNISHQMLFEWRK